MGVGSLKQQNSKLPLYIGVIISLVLFGGYYEFVSCILTIYFTLYYLYLIRDKKFIQMDISMILVVIIVVSYLVFVPFAIDTGVAFIGFLKFLPLIPFSMVVAQYKQEEREDVIKTIPIIGGIMVLICVFLSLNEDISLYLNVNGRLSGLFLYPNTFALFLLIGIIVLVEKYQKTNIQKLVIWIVNLGLLLYGMLQSGSRTCVIFLIVFALYSLVYKPLRRGGIWLSILLGCGVIGGVIYTIICGNVGSFARYLTISLESSTFLGRVLYAKDALGQIIRHPLGLGYMGYQYSQGEFQTGVYEVAYVHNDFLQFFLDTGWIAGIAMIMLIVHAIKSKRNTRLNKLIIIFMSLCTLLDFHLQYIGIFLIFILALDYAPISEELYQKSKRDRNKKRKRRKDKSQEYIAYLKIGKIWKYSLGGIGIGLSIYMGIALGSEAFGQDSISLSLYPTNTRVYLAQLGETSDPELSNQLSDKILTLNDRIAIAYREKAVHSFSQGKIEDMVNYKMQEIRYAKYNITSYTELIEMLEYGQQLYQEEGMIEGVEYCQRIIDKVPEILAEVKEGTSDIAWKIVDKPELELPR